MTIFTAILSSLLISNINFKTLPVEESGTNINTICQDNLGRIWMGGIDGIVRFDGNRYEHFTNNIRSGNQIPDNSVYDIICDSNGEIWVGHISGLSRYDIQTDTFENFSSDDGSVSEIVESTDDRLLTIIGGRLWIFDKKEETFSKNGIPSALYPQSIKTITRDDDHIYIGTKNGRIFTTSPDLDHITEIETTELKSEISCILKSINDELWVGTGGDGLWKISLNGGKCQRFVDAQERKNSSEDIIKALCFDEDGTLWIGTKKGLKIMHDDHLHVYLHENRPGSIPHNSVGALFSDKQGTMWLGTYYGGICYYTAYSSSFRHIMLKSSQGKIYGNIISDIIEDDDRSLWIGTNSGGLIHLTPDGRMLKIQENDEEESQLDVKAIFISPYSGLIYIGADRSELFVYDSKKKQLKPCKFDCAESCYAMEDNKKNGFYIGTAEGLYEYNEKTSVLSKIFFTGDNSNIKSLKLDSSGVLWIGKKNGITAIHTDDAHMIELPDCLSSIKYAEIIMEDSSGKVWFGSRNGLHSYDSRTGETKSFTEKDGLPHHVIHGIEEDKNGVLWISTDRGLCRFNPTNEEKLTFTTSDGLLDNRFTTYAHCMTKDGQLCFGSVNGFVMFDPQNISLDRKTLPPVICGLEINGLWNGVPDKRIELGPTQDNLTFVFSSPDYVSEKNGKMYYKLDGYDSEWNIAGVDRKASYKNLPQGEYVFKVRYIDSTGKESDETAEVSFKIRAFWYKTTAAMVVYIIIFMFSIMFLINWFVSRKEKKYKYKMEQFRNKILHDFSLEFRSQNNSGTSPNESDSPRNFDESDEKFMRNAMDVVRKNLDNAEFSIDNFAAKMFMSRSNLNLKIKALFGVSPLELIKTVRFNEACRLLQEKKHTMTEISDMVGFTTSSYFTSAFKRFMGCTPSEYVKKNS